jgi:hypothetical protein
MSLRLGVKFWLRLCCLVIRGRFFSCSASIAAGPRKTLRLVRVWDTILDLRITAGFENLTEEGTLRLIWVFDLRSEV